MDALNAEIARRAAAGESGQPEPSLLNLASQIPLTSRVEPHARAYLKEGRRREAATLYEFVTREDPSDAFGFNNLGFCQLPDDPESALRNLERAAALGYVFPAINVYNRVCCLVALGRPRPALRLVEDFFRSLIGVPTATPAVLWVGKGTEWTLQHDADAVRELENLRRILRERINPATSSRSLPATESGDEQH